MSEEQPEQWRAVLSIARDLTASLQTDNRYARLLAAVCRVIPCDAACLLRLDGDILIPLAARGLSRAALHRKYPRSDHPRLDALVGSTRPVRFPADSPLPDPFDGLVAGAPSALERVHDCMGCALTDSDEVIGVLTLDAFSPGAFDSLDQTLLEVLGALAGAALRTSALLEALEIKVERERRVASELGRPPGATFVGSSHGLALVRREIDVAAPSDLSLLITGETGVGKELVARLVHQASSRASEAWVHVNCAALPESLAEAELFGHVAGAFTGATRERAGKFEAADGGTLFLDEIGELPLSLQAKLLVTLQNGEIQRVGSDRVRRVNVRVLAATNRDLAAEVERGRFRRDLFHRLAAFPLAVPPLRQRPEDIPELCEHFGEKLRRQLGTGPIHFETPLLKELTKQSWPGNVRELENVVARAILRAKHEAPTGQSLEIGVHHLEFHPLSAETTTTDSEQRQLAPLRERILDFQRQEVSRALEESRGSWAGAAKTLGMNRSNLFNLAKRLGVPKK